MLTTNYWKSIGAALEYYQQSLSKEDFKYFQSEIKSYFQGKLADRMGLKGTEVTEKMFSSLLHNINPISGEKLRVRNIEGARCGYDFCVSLPKSISVQYSIKKNPEIIRALHYANTQMMQAIEVYAQYQVHEDTKHYYKYSREILYSTYLHHTTRPNEIKDNNGKTVFIAPDQNLHLHNFIHSATWNEDKQRFQALELGDAVYRRLPYFEALFHAHLSFALQKAGYQLKRTTERYDLAGISRSIIERFSNRTQTIEKFAKDHNITDPKIIGELGAKLRLSKEEATIKDEQELTNLWISRLTQEELETIQTLKGRKFKASNPLSLKECVDRAISHHLEREAAVPTERVLATAMTYGYGSYLPEDYRRELNSRNNILHHEIEGMAYMTTDEMRLAEERLIELATNGKGKNPPENPDYKPKDWFNAQQKNAVKTILNTSDRTIILRGSAGVGKTKLLKEVKNGVNQDGKSLFAVAPSSQATKVLENEGFEATTVAALLHNNKQEKLRNQVLLLDEGGQCTLKDLTKILELSEKHNFRCIISGDTRQHNPVGQDAMRILETQSKIQTVTVNKIMRQKPEAYKAAIHKLATGRTMQGYQDLDKKLGAIKEEPDQEKRLNQMVDDYIGSLSKGRTGMMISPTHFEGDILNSMARDKQKAKGQITGKEYSFDRLKSLSYTEAQKSDLVNFSSGMVVRFSRNQTGGLWAGSHHEVLPPKDNQSITIRDLKTGQIRKLPVESAKHFDVFQKGKISLAQGDLIQLTQNVKTGGKKLNNGNTYHIKNINKNSITLDNNKVIPNDTYHWKYAHASTSHSAQGKTKDDVFISMSDMSFAAVNEQTLYVSASRGRYTASIYTSSKDDLKRAVARSGVRVSAREVAEGHEQRLLQQKQQAHHRALNEKIKENGRTKGREKSASRRISKEFTRH